MECVAMECRAISHHLPQERLPVCRVVAVSDRSDVSGYSYGVKRGEKMLFASFFIC